MSAYLITGARILGGEVADLLIDNGEIVAVGKSADLSAQYPAADVLGSENHVVIPGLINSHHHVGLTIATAGGPNSTSGRITSRAARISRPTCAGGRLASTDTRMPRSAYQATMG